MRTPSFLFALTLLTAAIPAHAADEALPPPQPGAATSQHSASDNAPAEESKPNLNKDLAPSKGKEEVKVRAYTRKDGTQVTEYSVRGQVYMVKVQPPGDLPPYYLYDDNGDGQFTRRLPGGYKPLSPPMWVIKRF